MTTTLERDDRVAALARAELAHEFDLVDPVGHGRGTAVFAARERTSGRDVMLKVIARPERDPDAEGRFRAALGAQVTFDHPHLVPVLRFGATDSLFWFTRANIRATPLADVLAQGSRLDARRCRHLATQAASALEYLHRRGRSHGALTTNNILMDPGGWVHLCDPRIGLPAGRARSATPPFADADETSADQAALAAVLAECLGSEGVPAPMSRAIARALSPNPRDRYPRLTEFVWALEPDAPRAPTPAPRGRTSGGVLFVRDWEAPPTVGRGRLWRNIAIAIFVITIIGLAAPFLASLVRAPDPIRVNAAPLTDTPTATPPAPAPSTPVANTPRPSTADRPAATKAPPAPVVPAVLFINSSPWGRVLIDGTDVGNTPRANLSVAPGSRLVRIVRDGFVPFERRLQLSPGDTVRLTGIVLTERPR